MVLHEAEEEHLVLVAHRREKGVLEDGRGLLLQLGIGARDPAARRRRSTITSAHQQTFASFCGSAAPHSLLVQVVHLVRQHALEAKEGALFSRECSALSGGARRRSANQYGVFDLDHFF